MNRSRFLSTLAREREDILTADALVGRVVKAYRKRQLTTAQAATALREAGCFEAEIRETLS